MLDNLVNYKDLEFTRELGCMQYCLKFFTVCVRTKIFVCNILLALIYI